MRIMQKYRWMSCFRLVLLIYLTGMMLHDGLVDLDLIEGLFA